MMIMPILLLQKPSKSSKAKDHKKSLESRLEQWISGDFDAIVRKGRSIQKKLVASASIRMTSVSKRFSNLMFMGKVNAAIKLLSNESNGGILPINDEILKSLQQKHPEAQPEFEDLIIEGPIDEVNPATFNGIDGALI